MSYTGGVIPELIGNVSEAKRIFSFLKQALLHTTPDHPFRGPQEYCCSNLVYQCGAEGNIAHFTGKEIIFDNSRVVFIQDFIGGNIVDKLHTSKP